MLALVQRVSEAAVRVDGRITGEIETGLLVLFCAERGDDDNLCDRLLARLLKLRCFSDEAGRMNRSVVDVSGGLLIVPQFTLAADTRSGTRPSFTGAAPPEEGRRLFERFVTLARQTHAPVGMGMFGADMKVSLINDGPVTLWLRQEPKAEPST